MWNCKLFNNNCNQFIIIPIMTKTYNIQYSYTVLWCAWLPNNVSFYETQLHHCLWSFNCLTTRDRSRGVTVLPLKFDCLPWNHQNHQNLIDNKFISRPTFCIKWLNIFWKSQMTKKKCKNYNKHIQNNHKNIKNDHKDKKANKPKRNTEQPESKGPQRKAKWSKRDHEAHCM